MEIAYGDDVDRPRPAVDEADESGRVLRRLQYLLGRPLDPFPIEDDPVHLVLGQGVAFDGVLPYVFTELMVFQTGPCTVSNEPRLNNELRRPSRISRFIARYKSTDQYNKHVKRRAMGQGVRLR